MSDLKFSWQCVFSHWLMDSDEAWIC